MSSWNGAREVRGALERAVDMLVAEHLAADAHPGLEGIVASSSGARGSALVTAARLLDVGEVRGAARRSRAARRGWRPAISALVLGRRGRVVGSPR